MISLLAFVLVSGGALHFGAWAGKDEMHPSKHIGDRIICEDDSARVRDQQVKLKTCWKVTTELLPNEISQITETERLISTQQENGAPLK